MSQVPCSSFIFINQVTRVQPQIYQGRPMGEEAIKLPAIWPSGNVVSIGGWTMYSACSILMHYSAVKNYNSTLG